jgi:acyl carrier protein
MAAIISSRTPEGHDSRCPLCGAEAAIEYSQAGDASCPNCGSLLWGEEAVIARIQRMIANILGIDPEEVTPEFKFVGSLGTDSLDVVEIVMLLEEEFDINIPEEAAARIQTVGDAIRFILLQRQQREEKEAEE